MIRKRTLGRRAFTVVEIVLALSILVVVMVLTAKAGYWAMIERMHSGARQGALSAASNILESARATPWDSLTPEWAASRQLPEDWVQSQPDGKLKVQVEPEPSVPRCKRVTVTIRWDFRDGVPPRELQLVSSFAARAALQARNGS